jgi:hypothetical protein
VLSKINGIKLNEDFHDSIQRNSREAGCILAFWSNIYLQRLEDRDGEGIDQYIHLELQNAIEPTPKHVGLLLDGINPAAPPASHWLNKQTYMRNSALQQMPWPPRGNIETGRRRIVEAVQETIKETAAARRRLDPPADEIGRLLYLADRQEQESEIRSYRLTPSARVKLAIGGPNDALDLFISRLAHISLALPPDAFVGDFGWADVVAKRMSSNAAEMDGAAWSVHPIRLSGRAADAEALYGDILKTLFGWRPTGPMPEDLPELEAAVLDMMRLNFAHEGQRRLWHTEVQLDALPLKVVRDAYASLCTFWEGLPQPAGRFVLRALRPARKRGWFGFGQRNMARQFEQAGGLVLPELNPIDKPQMEDWRTVLASLWGVDETVIERELEPCFGNEALEMETLKERLRDDVLPELWRHSKKSRNEHGGL